VGLLRWQRARRQGVEGVRGSVARRRAVGHTVGRDNVVIRAVLALDQYGVGESVAGL